MAYPHPADSAGLCPPEHTANRLPRGSYGRAPQGRDKEPIYPLNPRPSKITGPYLRNARVDQCAPLSGSHTPPTPAPLDTLSQALRVFDDGADAFVAANAAVWDIIGAQAANAANANAGSTVFDACAGAGSSALPLAYTVGATGRVDAVDLSARLTAAGSRTAQHQGLTQLSYYTADAVTWAADRPSTYDAIVCTLGLMFVPDPTHAIAMFARSLSPGAWLTVTTWASGAMQPLISILSQARLDVGGVRPLPLPPFASTAAACEDPGALLDMAAEAGLDPVNVETTRRRLGIGGDTAWSLINATPLRGFLSGLSADQCCELRHRMAHDLSNNDYLVDAATLTLRAQQPSRANTRAPRSHPAPPLSDRL